MSARESKCATNGLTPYIVATSSWGRTNYSVVYGESLKDAKAHHGWTRDRHTSITVRRANIEDHALTRWGWCECCHAKETD